MATCGGQTARGGECFRPLVRVLNHVAGMHALELPPPRSTSYVLNLDNRSPYNWSTHMSCGQPMLPPSPGPRPALKPGSTGKHLRSPANGFSRMYMGLEATAGAYQHCGVTVACAVVKQSHSISHLQCGRQKASCHTQNESPQFLTLLNLHAELVRPRRCAVHVQVTGAVSEIRYRS